MYLRRVVGLAELRVVVVDVLYRDGDDGGGGCVAVVLLPWLVFLCGLKILKMFGWVQVNL